MKKMQRLLFGAVIASAAVLCLFSDTTGNVNFSGNVNAPSELFRETSDDVYKASLELCPDGVNIQQDCVAGIAACKEITCPKDSTIDLH